MTRLATLVAALFLFVTLADPRPSAQAAAEAALVARVRAIHERVITLDPHDDINPDNFTRQKNYTERLATEVNLPKMVGGGLDASFFTVYVGHGPLTTEGDNDAYNQAVALSKAPVVASQSAARTLAEHRRNMDDEQLLALKKIGIDQVGISSDFDGGGGVTGWNGAEQTFNGTLALVRRGYTEEQIGKIWSSNLLPVMADVEKVAKQIQSGHH